jgi:hypothetical protein
MHLFDSIEDLRDSGYIFRITDNGGQTFDRFTIIYTDGTYLGSSCNPCHPQGFGQHGEDIDVGLVADRVEAGEERDLRWIDLPEAVRECVFNGINMGFSDYVESAPAAANRDEARDWEGQWEGYGEDRAKTPIYRDGDAFRIRDDERAIEDGGDPGPFATFADAVRYMLPQDYDLSGPEYHTQVDLWDTAGGPAPLWDAEEEPPLPYEVLLFADDREAAPEPWRIELGRVRDEADAREKVAEWKAANPELVPHYRATFGGVVDRTFHTLKNA